VAERAVLAAVWKQKLKPGLAPSWSQSGTLCAGGSLSTTPTSERFVTSTASFAFEANLRPTDNVTMVAVEIQRRGGAGQIDRFMTIGTSTTTSTPWNSRNVTQTGLTVAAVNNFVISFAGTDDNKVAIATLFIDVFAFECPF
jgi:hypothetical protein